MTKIIELEDNDWRGCVDEIIGNCKYVSKNEHGTYFCLIDKIVQVEWYGCRPSEIKSYEEYVNANVVKVDN